MFTFLYCAVFPQSPLHKIQSSRGLMPNLVLVIKAHRLLSQTPVSVRQGKALRQLFQFQMPADLRAPLQRDITFSQAPPYYSALELNTRHFQAQMPPHLQAIAVVWEAIKTLLRFISITH